MSHQSRYPHRETPKHTRLGLRLIGALREFLADRKAGKPYKIRQVTRSFVCDFKTCERVNMFPLSEDHLPPHQRNELIAHGKAGAIAGLLIEHAGDGVYFAGWQMLQTDARSIAFAQMQRVGRLNVVPDLGPVIV